MGVCVAGVEDGGGGQRMEGEGEPVPALKEYSPWDIKYKYVTHLNVIISQYLI